MMTENEEMKDIEFLTNIVCSICDYAIEQKMLPDDVLSSIADRIQLMLRVSTFNGWKNNKENENG